VSKQILLFTFRDDTVSSVGAESRLDFHLAAAALKESRGGVRGRVFVAKFNDLNDVCRSDRAKCHQSMTSAAGRDDVRSSGAIANICIAHG